MPILFLCENMFVIIIVSLFTNIEMTVLRHVLVKTFEQTLCHTAWHHHVLPAGSDHKRMYSYLWISISATIEIKHCD